MNSDDLLDKCKLKMNNVLKYATKDFASLNTGKASPSMVETIPVEVYGSSMKISELAAIMTPDSRTITIQPWDKSTMGAIEKGILSANIGLNPVTQGEVIRCPIPEMSKERRKSLVKVAGGIAEEARIGVRATRKEILDFVKASQKAGKLSEDDAKRFEKEVQKETDAANQKVAKLLEKKEKDLMQA